CQLHCSDLHLFLLLLPPPPRSTLFPYTTLFRSFGLQDELAEGHIDEDYLVRCELFESLAAQAAAAVLTATEQLPVHTADVIVAIDRKSTRLNSSHDQISYAVFCLKKKKKKKKNN